MGIMCLLEMGNFMRSVLLIAAIIFTYAQSYAHPIQPMYQVPSSIETPVSKEDKEFLEGFYRGLYLGIKERSDQKEPSGEIMRSIFKDYTPDKALGYIDLISNSKTPNPLKQLLIELLYDSLENDIEP